MKKVKSMKKVLVSLSMLFCLGAATAAHAEDCNTSFLERLNCLFMSSAYITFSNLGAFQNPREAYVAQLRDDAADLVGSPDGTAVGAVLKNAIADIRAKDSTTQSMSDNDIALKILSLN